MKQSNHKTTRNNITDILMFLSFFASMISSVGNIASYIADKPKLQLLCLLGTMISFPCLIATSIPDLKKGLKKEHN